MKHRIFFQQGAAISIALTMLFMGVMFSSAGANTPDLPAELRETPPKASLKSQQMVFLDFYSPMCSTCLMMEKPLAQLKGKTNGQILFRRIDVTAMGNEKYAENFQIDGTPNYILFSPEGKAIYRMSTMISPLVLEKQVLRLSGQLKPVNFPSEVSLPPVEASPLASDRLHDLLLVSFESEDCSACKTMAPYLNGFEMTGQEGLRILRLDTTTPGGKKLMEKLAIKKAPAYVLFDNAESSETPDSASNTSNSRAELIRMEGDVKPLALWELIRLFGSSGV